MLMLTLLTASSWCWWLCLQCQHGKARCSGSDSPTTNCTLAVMARACALQASALPSPFLRAATALPPSSTPHPCHAPVLVGVVRAPRAAALVLALAAAAGVGVRVAVIMRVALMRAVGAAALVVVIVRMTVAVPMLVVVRVGV